MTKPISSEKYLRGAGLALKAGERGEAAEFFLKGGEFETAALLFEKLERHGRAAVAYTKAGQPLDAAAAWERAGEYSRAAEIYAEADNIPEAARAFACAGESIRAAELFAQTGRFLDAAKAASEANAEKTMITYLQKVTPSDPDYREAALVLARALTRRGWSALAIETIERVLGEEPVREEALELWYELARAHEEHGELTEASEILHRILACQYNYRKAESWQRRLHDELEARASELDSDESFRDRYVVGELLGRGGMGAVYKATDKLLEREVAYKVLPEEMAHEPGALDQLLKEARAAAALNHPNIITIHDVGLDGGQGYIAMELVEGESYARMLQRQGRLDLAEVMHFLVSVCQGLDHAHRRGVIHRDIKPSNILLTVEDRVKIVDFGLAQSARASTKQPVGGTVKYIAPEQARGHKTDARTDIYSLGATLYELITGSAPFTTGNIVKHHLETPRATAHAGRFRRPADTRRARAQMPRQRTGRALRDDARDDCFRAVGESSRALHGVVLSFERAHSLEIGLDFAFRAQESRYQADVLRNLGACRRRSSGVLGLVGWLTPVPMSRVVA